MRRAIWTVTLIGCLGVSAAAAYARSQTPPREVYKPQAVAACFQGDRRLLPALDVAEQDRPLGDWMKSLSAKLGLPLSVTRNIADDKITAFLDRRPAGEVLTLIARHQGLEWIKGKSGYLLAAPPELQQRLARQRQEEWQLLQGWMERHARLDGIPEEQLSARRRELERLLQAQDLAPERRQELADERDLLVDHSRHSRTVPVAVRIYRSLTPVQLEVLRSTGFVRLSSAFGTLSPQVVAATHEALGNKDRDKAEEGEPHAEVTFTLSEMARDASRPHGARQLKLYVELTAVVPDRSTSMLNWRPRSPAAELPAKGGATVDDPDLQRPLELKLAAEHAALKVAEAGISAYTLAKWPETVRLASIAEALHRLTERDVIADSFTRARLSPALLVKQRSAAELLECVSKELDYTWAQEGKVLFLQSRTRAYDRSAEVPERVLQPFRRRVMSVSALGLDDYAALASTLTDSQCRGLDDFWGYYLEGTGVAPLWTSGGLYEARHGLRLWASLTPVQRRQALAEILTTDRMTELQRRACAVAISAPGDDLSRPDCIRIPTPESLPGRSGGFQVKPRAVEAQAFRDENGSDTATISTVGSPLRGFNRLGMMGTPLGPKTRMDAFDFVYYVADGTDMPRMVRSTNLHLVPRWERPP